MGKWCLHASSFIFDWIIIKVAGNQDRHNSLDEFDFGPLVSVAHVYVFWNEIWPWHIGLRWAIIALWATCFDFYSKSCFQEITESQAVLSGADVLPTYKPSPRGPENPLLKENLALQSWDREMKERKLEMKRLAGNSLFFWLLQHSYKLCCLKYWNKVFYGWYKWN